MKKNNAQISLELGAALICIFLLLLASVKLCTWAVTRIAYRQQDYETTRTSASSTGAEVNESDPSKYPKLDFFR
ncbi:MAG: hypothetical protein A3K83_03710 [Omnitrophica WOR_2 bacterium RBG_13_44_8b]|nr:MAG: hypothetical protein A3K83_03710 [Omnitrophica WOR_2 bacterium RBG_13_44_8b]